MSGSKATESIPFSLETDDRTDEERAQARHARMGRLGPVLGLGSSEKTRAPMDTDYQEEPEDTTAKIRINLTATKDLMGLKGDKEEVNPLKFDKKKLFEAAASGDVTKLHGLHQYLRQSLKCLTNTEYKSDGKTALLKALLNLRNGRNNTIEHLLNISEERGDIKSFVNTAYSDIYYKGQTALHVAIERRSLYFVKLLIEKGADVHARACGKFFQPHNDPCFYFGELPLSLAACTNQKDIVDHLMDNPHQKVDVKMKDSLGNMVLHALVIVADNSPENTKFITVIYDHILIKTAQRHPKCKLEEIQNKQGLTPIKLAAKTGKIKLFEHMLHREFSDPSAKHLSRKYTEWVYGPVHTSLYDLESLDTYENNSVLEILVYGSEIPNRHKMLEIEPLNKMLEDKWDRFAGRIFLIYFLAYIFYLVVFTTICYNRPKGKPPHPIEHTTQEYLRLTGQLLVLAASIYFFFKGLLDLKRKRPKLQTLLIDGYCDILFLVQAVFFMASALMYVTKREEYLGFLVLCLALSWINLLYFSRGSKHMGIYSVMIQKMILSDILRFLFVYMVFLFGFSAAVVTLLVDDSVDVQTNNTKIDISKGTNITGPPLGVNSTNKGRSLFIALPNHANNGDNLNKIDQSDNSDDADVCRTPSYRNISFTTLELFKFTIGMGDLEFTQDYKYREVFYVLLISYIVLTYILLLNMLIALMNKTVETLSKESTTIWKLQRAITILDLEKGLPCCLKRKLRSGVKKDLCCTGEDRRWCFRVEDVNWNKWNTNVSSINEDPGEQGIIVPPSPEQSDPRRGSSLRFLRNLSRRRRQPETIEELEMND